jgi:ABC-type nitrate/sulfonate/bicarbonate transport system substrate-binding protein
MRGLCSSVLAVLVLAAALSSACGDTLTLRYGQTASTLHSVFALPIFIAEREGFFAREGLAVKVVPIAGGTTEMVAALDDGTVDITHVSTPFLIKAHLAGSDAVAIAGEFANPIYSLVAKPEIARFADLKGKLVGLAVAADTVAISTRRLLARNGLRAADYRVKEMVGTPARAECLMRGECDAVPLGQPDDFLAREKGYHILGLTSDAVPKFQYTVTAVRRSFATANHEALVRYVRALAAAFRFIHDPSERDAVVKTIVETTNSSAAIARQILALYLDPDRGVLPKDAELDLAGLAQVIAFMGETGAIKGPLPPPDDFVDLDYLHDAGVK